MIKSPLAKALLSALVGLAVVVISGLASDNGFSQVELLAAVTAVANTFLTWLVANTTAEISHVAKALTPAVLTAVTVIVLGVQTDGLSGGELVVALTGFLQAAAALLAPNLPPTFFQVSAARRSRL